MSAAIERDPHPTLAVALLDPTRQHIRRAEELRDEQAFRPLIDSAGAPSCTMRPWSMTATRSARESASTWSWVTNKAVIPICR